MGLRTTDYDASTWQTSGLSKDLSLDKLEFADPTDGVASMMRWRMKSTRGK